MTKRVEVKVSGVVALLMAARETLVVHGWTQGAYRKGNAFCAVGALAFNDYSASGDTVEKAKGILAKTLMVREGWALSVSSWNDTPERTKEEVLALFDEAIAAELAR